MWREFPDHPAGNLQMTNVASPFWSHMFRQPMLDSQHSRRIPTFRLKNRRPFTQFTITVEIPKTQAREEPASALEGASLEAETAEAPLEQTLPRPQSALHALKQDVGPLSLERVLQEIDKLERVHQLGLPADLFAHVSAK